MVGADAFRGRIREFEKMLSSRKREDSARHLLTILFSVREKTKLPNFPGPSPAAEAPVARSRRLWGNFSVRRGSATAALHRLHARLAAVVCKRAARMALRCLPEGKSLDADLPTCDSQQQ